MRIIAGIVILLLVLAGGAFVYLQYFYIYPLEVSKAYIDTIVEGDYENLEMYFHSQHPAPTGTEIATTFKQFAAEYGLTSIELVGLNPIEEKLREAEYIVDLRYESEYFDPLLIQFKLQLAWDSFLTWKIKWNDVLPVPAHGIEAKYTRTRIEPNRGNLYDREGVLIAGEGSVVTIGVQPGRISDPELLYQVLSDNLGLSPEYVKGQYLASGVQDHWFVPLVTVTEMEYQELDPLLRPIPGIFFQRQHVRYYPAADTLAHLTGYVGEVSAQMIQDFPERRYQTGDIVGRSGLEAGLEETLGGKPGYRLFVDTKEMREMMLLERPVVNGDDINLTIDLAMQQLAFRILEDFTGSFVVLDANTGEVLVLATSPSFDPNEFVMGISSQRWQELSNDPERPLFNRTLQGKFPPGSVFKALTATVALDQNLFTIDDEFFDIGELRVEGNIIRNFQQEEFGEHYLADGVVRSINTTLAKVGLEIGSDLLSEYFTRLRLDKAPDFNLEAVAGQIGNPGRSKVGLAWTAIGQDQVLMTPFHVASLFTIFANEGRLPRFHLVKGGEQENDNLQVIQPETAQTMGQLLEEVVRVGTGKAAAVEGLNIKGKTGTAETGTGPSHGWFGGYVEDINGRNLSFAVLVEEGGIGGQAAAPLIRQFFQQLLRL